MGLVEPQLTRCLNGSNDHLSVSGLEDSLQSCWAISIRRPLDDSHFVEAISLTIELNSFATFDRPASAFLR